MPYGTPVGYADILVCFTTLSILTFGGRGSKSNGAPRTVPHLRVSFKQRIFQDIRQIPIVGFQHPVDSKDIVAADGCGIAIVCPFLHVEVSEIGADYALVPNRNDQT